MKVTLIFDDRFPLESEKDVSPVELAQVAHCFTGWDDLMRIEVDAGGDVLKVSLPLEADSLDGWRKAHPRIVKAYTSAFLEKEAEVIARDECTKVVHIRRVILGERMHFVGVG